MVFFLLNFLIFIIFQWQQMMFCHKLPVKFSVMCRKQLFISCVRCRFYVSMIHRDLINTIISWHSPLSSLQDPCHTSPPPDWGWGRILPNLPPCGLSRGWMSIPRGNSVVNQLPTRSPDTPSPWCCTTFLSGSASGGCTLSGGRPPLPAGTKRQPSLWGVRSAEWKGVKS